MSLQEKASQDQVFAVCPVYRAFLAITRSMAIAGISPLLIPRYRRVFRGNWPRIRPAPRLLFAIEIANLIAVDTSQYAVSCRGPRESPGDGKAWSSATARA